MSYAEALRRWLTDRPSPSRAGAASGAVLVAGCGTMGRQIAQLAVEQGLQVGLFDANVDLAIQVAADLAQSTGSNPQVHRAVADLEDSNYCLAIETIVEQVFAKQQLLGQLEQVLPDDCLLASNTSTLSLAILARPLRRPERLVGLHFLLPVPDRELIEIVAQDPPVPSVIEQACDWCRRLDRLPLVVGDQTGFLVNRLLFAVLSRAIDLWLRGVAPLTIDQAALEFGLGFGPLIAMDHIGLDTVVRAGAGFWQKFPERPRPSPLLPALVKRGRLGRKTEGGVFDYHQFRPESGETGSQLRFLNELANVNPGGVCPQVQQVWQTYANESPAHLTVDEIQIALWSSLLDEAIAVCEDGYVDDPRAVDAAWLFGLGLNASLGGPFYWAACSGQLAGFAPSLPRPSFDASQWKEQLKLWSARTLRLASET